MAETSFRERFMGAWARSSLNLADVHRLVQATPPKSVVVSYDVLNKLKGRPDSSTKADKAAKIRAALAQWWDPEDVATSSSNEPLTRAAPDLAASDDFTGAPMAFVPVYDVDASAGPGLIPPDQEAVAYRLELPADYLSHLTSTRPDELQVIRVKGISMLPTLKPGDLIMVDPRKQSLAYDGLFVVSIDGAVLVKRIGRGSRSGTVSMISDNRAQDAFERPIADVTVIGKVIWAGVAQ